MNVLRQKGLAAPVDHGISKFLGTNSLHLYQPYKKKSLTYKKSPHLSLKSKTKTTSRTYSKSPKSLKSSKSQNSQTRQKSSKSQTQQKTTTLARKSSKTRKKT